VPGPTLTLGFIIATLLGAAFHLIMGGEVRRLAVFLLSGWVGFGLGQVLGGIFDINLLPIGTLRLFTAVFGALVALVVAHILTSEKRKRTPR
jgi:membrane associated rhomboid family serine protease